jgi:hypothetical protein
VGVDQGGAAIDDLDPGIAQQTLIDAVQALDLGVLVFDQGTPVEIVGAGGFDGPAIGCGIGEILMIVRRIDEQPPMNMSSAMATRAP